MSRDTQTWNRRYREYTEKIKTGGVFEVAEVLRDLCVLRMTKELSFGERKMLDTARGLLIKELAIAKGVGEDKIRIINLVCLVAFGAGLTWGSVFLRY